MDRLLKIAEVQELTGLGRSTVYKKVAAGLLPAPVRLSRCRVGAPAGGLRNCRRPSKLCPVLRNPSSLVGFHQAR